MLYLDSCFREFTVISAVSDLSLGYEENHSRLGFTDSPVSLATSGLHHWKPSEYSII